MAKIKKTVKYTAIAAAAGASLYLAAGDLIYKNVLSHHAVNKAPDEVLNEPDKMRRYLTNEDFRKSDDWFIAENPADTLLLNEKGETLHANIIMAEKASSKWAICVHGYTSCPRNMAIPGRHFHEMGYNCVFPYMRGHRNSEQNSSSMGYYEKYDILSWINYIISMDPKAQIVLIGVSMGSATIMLTTGEALPSNVKCAIADCGYTSCWEEFSVQIRELLHLPVFPFLYAANTVCKIKGNWDFRKCKPLEAVAHSSTPTLFIHGDKDTLVPYWMMDVLYDHCTAPKDKLTVPDAQHAESWEVNPPLYWDKVKKFLKAYVK